MKRHVLTPAGVLVALALMLIRILPACTGVPVTTYQTKDSSLNLAQYVNPFIGTSPFSDAHSGFYFDSGDVTPAATYPMGMVQWGPDTTTSIPGHYYYPDTTIKSFSLTHFSGRGCSALGDIPFMPYVGAFASLSSFSHSNESAHPGYYQVRLDGPNVNVELAAAAHSGMGQFTYPSSTQSSMLINAGGSVNGNSNASVTINTSDNEIIGQATSTVGCGSEHYTLYFAAQFDRSFTHSSGNGTPAANLTFDTTSNQVVHVRVGISFVSVANARQNRDREIGSSNFTAVRNAANASWNARLNTIQVQGGAEDEKVIFYTALYHCFFHPNVFSDVNGQYPGFDGKIHTVARGHAQYENIPGWDNYRSLIRLRAIIAPGETSDIAQSLVNDAQQGDGHLPRWEQANADSHGMNGDSGDIEVAEAYVFGDTNFDAPGALMAMVNGQPKVREGYNDYVKLGYVANGTTGNSVVITQEYTNDDFAIAQFAQALGNTADYNTFMQRSKNWTNVLDTTSGYVQPRNSNGSWAANFSSTSEHGFQETDSAQSTWMESFNLRGLFHALGGNSVVVSRLDTFFTRLNDGPSSQYAFMGNEPSEEIPWEYDFAGAPSHTQEVVRRIETQLFTNIPGGLPGNDDAGSLSSWYVFAAIGLYPEIPGVGGFVIGSPLFTSVTVHLAGGHTLQINAPAASDKNPYVQSLNLNGQSTTGLWLPWSTLKSGATLDFILGSSATSWGSSASDAPPSYP
ncbi:MAG TPA: GH92 family glycosyl hydrolase [Ktedonobacteraceae bacterium]